MTGVQGSREQWPTRRQSLRLMWRYRRGIGVAGGGHQLGFVWDLLRLRRSDWYLWAASMRAWEEHLLSELRRANRKAKAADELLMDVAGERDEAREERGRLRLSVGALQGKLEFLQEELEFEREENERLRLRLETLERLYDENTQMRWQLMSDHMDTLHELALTIDRYRGVVESDYRNFEGLSEQLDREVNRTAELERRLLDAEHRLALLLDAVIEHEKAVERGVSKDAWARSNAALSQARVRAERMP